MKIMVSADSPLLPQLKLSSRNEMWQRSKIHDRSNEGSTFQRSFSILPTEIIPPRAQIQSDGSADLSEAEASYKVEPGCGGSYVWL
jgi:hypothetical protein